MPTQIIFKAERPRSAVLRERRVLEPGSLAVVLLLAALFAVTIVAALQPPHLVAADQAVIQGGL